MVERLETLQTYRCPDCGFRSKGTDPVDAEFRPSHPDRRVDKLKCPSCGAGHATEANATSVTPPRMREGVSNGLIPLA
ncbi:hypothetical protein SAMN05216226_104247 [Halovenus aranensis]|uniref:Uncharacterized protein n=1 Tax=Halovenus aranensis TaxID=890420 RepID=A0A1G8UGJ6_9EURY|nr:hypothetical protein SAMN05216226_104247 [Halovenus aranensis]